MCGGRSCSAKWFPIRPLLRRLCVSWNILERFEVVLPSLILVRQSRVIRIFAFAVAVIMKNSQKRSPADANDVYPLQCACTMQYCGTVICKYGQAGRWRIAPFEQHQTQRRSEADAMSSVSAVCFRADAVQL